MIDDYALSSGIMSGHRNPIGYEPDSNRNRIGLQRIAKDCNPCGGARSTPRSNRGPRMWFLVWNDLPGRACRGASLQCIRPLAAVTLPGLISKVCIVTTVYILIMGSIRSFDGRNCDWLSKAELSVSFRRNPTGFEADSNRNRIGIESESNRTQIQYFIYIK